MDAIAGPDSASGFWRELEGYCRAGRAFLTLERWGRLPTASMAVLGMFGAGSYGDVLFGWVEKWGVLRGAGQVWRMPVLKGRE